MTRRIQRINELLREEISLVIQRQLRDPRLAALISITRIETAEDMSHSKVYISVMGDAPKKEEAVSGLTSASGFIRKEVGEVIPLRRIPSLSFHIDDSLEKGERVLRMLDRLSRE